MNLYSFLKPMIKDTHVWLSTQKMKRVVVTPFRPVYKAQIDMTQLNFDHLFVLYCIGYDY